MQFSRNFSCEFLHNEGHFGQKVGMVQEKWNWPQMKLSQASQEGQSWKNQTSQEGVAEQLEPLAWRSHVDLWQPAETGRVEHTGSWLQWWQSQALSGAPDTHQSLVCWWSLGSWQWLCCCSWLCWGELCWVESDIQCYGLWLLVTSVSCKTFTNRGLSHIRFWRDAWNKLDCFVWHSPLGVRLNDACTCQSSDASIKKSATALPGLLNFDRKHVRAGCISNNHEFLCTQCLKALPENLRDTDTCLGLLANCKDLGRCTDLFMHRHTDTAPMTTPTIMTMGMPTPIAIQMRERSAAE